jgi:hypothetical protein
VLNFETDSNIQAIFMIFRSNGLLDMLATVATQTLNTDESLRNVKTRPFSPQTNFETQPYHTDFETRPFSPQTNFETQPYHTNIEKRPFSPQMDFKPEVKPFAGSLSSSAKVISGRNPRRLTDYDVFGFHQVRVHSDQSNYYLKVTTLFSLCLF